ncbi:MAG: tetratricopeptide repeat protein, partial [Sphingobacteriales bacterium]
LGKHTELPEGVEENCVTGTVLVGFIVNEDGSVDSVQALYGPHPVLEKVSVQAIKKSSGRWKPGSFHDTTVRVRMTQLMTYNFPSCPDDSYYYNLGVASFKKGELETARKYFSRAYAMNFRNLDAVFNWAVTNIKLGDLTNACEKFRDLNARGYPKAQEYLDSYCR